jgi:hypothetical protein
VAQNEEMNAQKFRDNYVEGHQYYITEFFISLKGFQILFVIKVGLINLGAYDIARRIFFIKFVSQ